MNNKIIKKAIKCLDLKRHIVFKEHKRIIRKQIDKVAYNALGYYTFDYQEKWGQYHVIDYSTKAHNPIEVIVHELIHAWQAENGFWDYGHGKDFKSLAVILALETGLDYEDILKPDY